VYEYVTKERKLKLDIWFSSAYMYVTRYVISRSRRERRLLSLTIDLKFSIIVIKCIHTQYGGENNNSQYYVAVTST